MVGDRYGLAAQERQVLRRGVASPVRARERRGRRLCLAQVGGLTVGVDGHNILITLESALGGKRLVLADDGWVRDVAQLGRHHRPGELTRRGAALAVAALAEAGAAGAWFWLDAPLHRSGELARELEEMMHKNGLAGGARAVPAPERELAAHQGPVASSDRVVIDQAAQPLDLAGEIIRGLRPAPWLEGLR